MSALGQKQTCAVHEAMSAKCHSGHQTVIRLLHLRVAGTIRGSLGQAPWQS